MVVDLLRRGLGIQKPAAPDEHKRKLELERLYRELFRSKEGRIVFTHMLEELSFFDPATTQEAQSLKNYASLLIYRCGFRTSLGIANAILDSKPTEE